MILSKIVLQPGIYWNTNMLGSYNLEKGNLKIHFTNATNNSSNNLVGIERFFIIPKFKF